MLHNSTVPSHTDSETGPSFETVTEYFQMFLFCWL